jgi:succinyl-CoA synthetase beta subunit
MNFARKRFRLRVIGGWEMNIHEYQGKEVLRQYGVTVPNGKVAFTVEEAVEAAKELGTEVCVVKAQIHAGGRGKAGGVKVAKNLEEVRTYASEILGKTLVTHQTGPEGKEVKRLLIEEGCDIKKEYYVGLLKKAELKLKKWQSKRLKKSSRNKSTLLSD